MLDQAEKLLKEGKDVIVVCGAYHAIQIEEVAKTRNIKFRYHDINNEKSDTLKPAIENLAVYEINRLQKLMRQARKYRRAKQSLPRPLESKIRYAINNRLKLDSKDYDPEIASETKKLERLIDRIDKEKKKKEKKECKESKKEGLGFLLKAFSIFLSI